MRKKREKKNILALLIKGFLIFFISTILIGFLLVVFYIRDLPRPEKFTEGVIPQSTKIYDREGEILLYEVTGEEKRTIVSLDVIPDYLQKAVVATEDNGFYQHQGIDLKGLFRAVLIDLKLGKPTHGGSTITQQLIRSYFLTTKKTLERKTREIILSLELERRYPKEQILEWYLNLIPFGSNLYGVEAASQTFFGKSVAELSLPESAVMAAIIKAPSYLWPNGSHKEELLARKNYVLDRMVINKYITQEEAAAAKEEEIVFTMESAPIEAPHFITTYIMPYLEDKYGRDHLNKAGLRIYTTLNIDYQKRAEVILEEKLEELKIYNAYNGGLVVLDPRTGELLVMIGSKDWQGESAECSSETGRCKFNPKVNVTLSLRQPGSAFKPFVYATAFEKGYTPETLLWDIATEFNPNCSPAANQSFSSYGGACYHPRNYNNTFSGLITLRSALAQSRNLPSVKLLYLANVEDSLAMANKLGITTLKSSDDYGLALVLGGGEVKLLDMAYGYGVFANDGIKAPQNFILKIEDNKGNIIEEVKRDNIRILSAQTARKINDILSDNEARSPMFGYNSLLHFEEYQVAAKTGTTQYLNDAWTIGYTPSLVTAVWVGNNDNTAMTKAGISLAGPIWHDTMDYLLANSENTNFINPQEKTERDSILTGQDLNNHSILHYINKKDPQGPALENPSQDPQYNNWEYAVKRYLGSESD